MSAAKIDYRTFRLELFTTYATLRITTDAARPMDTPTSGVSAKQAMLAAITELSKDDRNTIYAALDIARNHMLETVKSVGSFRTGRSHEEQVYSLCKATLHRHDEIQRIIRSVNDGNDKPIECAKICHCLLRFEGVELDKLKLTLPLQLGYYLYKVNTLLGFLGRLDISDRYEQLIDKLNFRKEMNYLFASDLYASRKVKKFLLQTFPAVIVEIIKAYDVARTDRVIIGRLLTLHANFAC